MNQEIATEEKAAKFELKTHHRDNKGRLLKVDPYRLHIMKGEKVFERPPGSGNTFYENGEPAGRMIYDLNEVTGQATKKYNAKAEHVAWIPPLVGAEANTKERDELEKQNEMLKRELEAIKGEQADGGRVQSAGGKAQSPSENAAPPKPPETKPPVEVKAATNAPGGVTGSAQNTAPNFGDLIK